MHYIWTFLFGVNFSLMAFSIYPLLTSQRLILVWWIGFVSLLVCILWSIGQFVRDRDKIGVPEHITFMVYNATFIAFFLNN